MFAPSLIRYSDDGPWEWLESEPPPPREHDFPFEARYVALEGAECPAFASANTFGLDDATAIGGIPMWLQDSEYPYCPACAERMIFVAQHDNAATRAEGLYYAFFCATCHIAAVNYQQT
jgi:hypothetical protein